MNAKPLFVAGIDGGGTKTTVVCRSLEGETLCRRYFGSFNINSIGEKGMSSLLLEITSFLNEQGQCKALCIGAAGASNPRMKELTALAMKEADIRLWRLTGDQEIAFYGALSGRPGCVLIAGTGSICFGQNAAGESFRAGGWGHRIGDEGSGYALGRDALAAVAHWYDGYGSETVLTEIFSREFGFRGRESMIEYAYGGDKSRIASLAPLVEQAAELNDQTAAEIILKNTKALVRLTEAVIKKLSLEHQETALLGGILRPGSLMRRQFLDQMHTVFPGVTCVSPENPPEMGAASIALSILKEGDFS